MQIKVARTFAREQTLTLFGDSIPKGLYFEGKRIRRIGRCAVDSVAERFRLKVDNRSAFGMTLSKCVEKGYFAEALRQARPGELIAVSLGGNDCDYDWEEVAKDPFAFHLPHTPLPLFEELLEDTMQSFAKAGVRAVFSSLPPVSSQRYFDNVIAQRADGAEIMKFFAGDVTNIARHQEAYSNAIVRAALAHGLPLIDCRTEFLMKPDMLDYLSDDGIHPNQAGHDLIAECVIRQAEALLPARREEGSA